MYKGSVPGFVCWVYVVSLRVRLNCRHRAGVLSGD